MTLPQPMLDQAAQEDLERIRQVVLDYIEGWYTGDAARMERTLHPDLVKRCILADPRGFDRLEPISALGMLIATRHGGGSRTPPEKIHNEIIIHEVHGPIASASVRSTDYVDYLHLGCFLGRWQIVNVLWARS